MKIIVVLGRVLFALIFILTGPRHFSAGMAQYAASHGVPAASVLVPISGIVALLGGLSILFGFKARIGAWLIVIYLIPVTLFMHNFWAVTDPMMKGDQMSHFFKNLALIGGALLITQFGSGTCGAEGASCKSEEPAAPKPPPVA